MGTSLSYVSPFTPSPTVFSPARNGAFPAPVWTSTFFDDFPGTSLSTVNWFPGAVWDGTNANTRGFTAGAGGPGGPSGEFQLYTPSNVTVAGSICTLTAQAQSISGDPNNGGLTPYNYTSGCIQTQPGIPTAGTTGFLYNLATRTRLSASIMFAFSGGQTSMTGFFPAFWSSSASTNYFSNPYVLEVDVEEWGLGGVVALPQCTNNIHYCSSGSVSSCDAQTGPTSPSIAGGINTITVNTYHTYMVDMNYDGHGSFAFYTDGICTKTWQNVPGYAIQQNNGAPVEMSIICNFAINTASPTAAALPATMNIDWVKVETTPTFCQVP